ncbi:Ycf66 family protein [Synechocystis sp. PCC 7338]|uniref:Ycf66 family protein n=1 Tax=Synechocystis sp. PCC 7338 TaxID=2732530 RepID=UPI001BB0CDD2|nr:Ycf66 family protein [Synechocystis sp. PCC 7338]QUS59757.1 hypothetical protein HTZ78_03070 [Synechocystis sp. PCC 7338]
MVNFGLNSASILGIFLAVAGAGLYFLRSVRPEVSRDYDIFFSAVGLLCGLILLFQGWRLDPILQFGQLLLSGSTVFFAAETIRLRGITTEQARRSAPYADDRRVSKTRVYTEAELDQLEPEDEPVARNNRRLRGYDDDARSGRPDGYGEAEARARPRPPSGRSAPPPNTKPIRSRPPAGRSAPQRPAPGYSDNYGYEDDYSGWDSGANDVWDDPTPSRRPSSRRPRPEASNPPNPPRRPSNRRPRPTTGPSSDYDSFGDRPERNAPRNARPYEDEPPAAYVDYQPIDEADLTPRPTTPEDQEQAARSGNPRSQRPSRPPVDAEEPPMGADDQERFDY